MSEFYYTRFTPIELHHNNIVYYVYGYTEDSGVLTSMSATSDINTHWTKALVYFDEDLLNEVLKHITLPKQKKKRKS